VGELESVHSEHLPHRGYDAIECKPPLLRSVRELKQGREIALACKETSECSNAEKGGRPKRVWIFVKGDSDAGTFPE
jgi:hypothetical protein